MAELEARCERIAQEHLRVNTRLATLTEQQQEQAYYASLSATVEEFCRNIQAALHTPSFETKQRILRLVVPEVS